MSEVPLCPSLVIAERSPRREQLLLSQVPHRPLPRGVSYERGTSVAMPLTGHREDFSEVRAALALPGPAPSSSAPPRRPCRGFTVRNVQRFRDGLVFEAHRLLYHSA